VPRCFILALTTHRILLCGPRRVSLVDDADWQVQIKSYIFARAGWAPEDRNVIDQFYSFGIGGYGMLIPGRDNDNWGIGWSGIHISSDLCDFPVGLRSFEHAVEVFYNFWLTPATHLSLNTQAIRPADESADTAYTLGARLQLDF
jgi:porin